MPDQWGIGSKAEETSFATAKVGKEPVGLVMGEHPHSRSDNKIYARFPSGRTEGFNGFRLVTRVEVEESNYLKESELSGSEVRKGGSCRIYFNDQIVYEFFHRDAQRACIKAYELIDQLKEHAVMQQMIDENVPASERLRGRKVYYRDTPAVCGLYMPDQGCVMFEAESGHKFPVPAWADDPYYEETDSVKDSILSPHVWWWRT